MSFTPLCEPDQSIISGSLWLGADRCKVYNSYLIVIAAVIGAGLLASIVSTAVSILYATSAEVEILELLGGGWARFINIALSGIGSTTLVFAVLERVIPGDGFNLDEEEQCVP